MWDQIPGKRVSLVVVLLGLLFPDISFGQSNTVNILPLGNSITVGYTDGTTPLGQQTSFRFGLYYHLTNAGYDFNFVGTEESGCSYFTDCQHGGINGFRDQYMVRLLTDGYDDKRDIQLIQPPGPYLDPFDPDIILIHIGTNDITHETNPGTTYVESVLDLIDEYEIRAGKTVTVFLALIINRMLGYPLRTETTNYNNQLRSMAETRIQNGDNLVVVDMENDAGLLYTSEDMTDYLHPNAVGYNKMAMLWFNSINAYFNQPPDISPLIPDQTIPQGGTFNTVGLDNHIVDEESNPEEIAWTVVGTPVNLNVTINTSRQLSVAPKNAGWFGSESVILKAEDSGVDGSFKKSDRDTIVFTVTEVVNEPPVISPDIPDQTVPEGDPFESINLDDYVEDAETPDGEITWTYSPASPTNLNVDINGQRQATVTAKDDDWYGSESITFTAEDGGVNGSGSKSASAQVLFTVTPVDDPPEFTSVPKLTAYEDSIYFYSARALDPEGSTLTYSAKLLPEWLSFSVSTRMLSGIPLNDHLGDNEVILSVSDGNKSSDQAFTIFVENRNDIPVIVGQAKTIKTSINMAVEVELEDLLVQDPDNIYPDDFALDVVSAGDNYVISGNIVIPDKDYLGTLVVPVKVFDGEDFSPVSNINVQVVLSTALNNPAAPGEVEVYPNPSSGSFNFRIMHEGEVWLEIFSTLGEKVFSRKYRLFHNEISIDFENEGIKPGVYMYRIRSDQFNKVGRILKH